MASGVAWSQGQDIYLGGHGVMDAIPGYVMHHVMDQRYIVGRRGYLEVEKHIYIYISEQMAREASTVVPRIPSAQRLR